MTLKVIEGFDYFGTVANLLRRWRSGTPDALTIEGGREQYGLAISAGGLVVRDLPAPLTAVGVGFGFFMRGQPTGGGEILRLIDTTSGDAVQITLAYDNVGALEVYRGDLASGTRIAGPSVVRLLPGAWEYLELKVNIANAGGIVRVAKGGTDILTASSLDTQATANQAVGAVGLCGIASGSTVVSFDDLYLIEPGGTYNSDLLGDVRVRALRPTSNGLLMEFTPNTGAGWAAVDDETPDDDATFVSHTSTQVFANFFYGTIPTADVVKGVDVVLLARGTVAGRTVAPILRVDQGNDNQRPSVTLSTTYGYLGGIYEQNDDSSTALTTTQINVTSHEFQTGLAITNPLVGLPAGQVRVTQVVTQILVVGVGSTATIRVTQDVVEAAVTVAAGERVARVTQVPIEVAVAPTGAGLAAQVTQVVTEAMVKPDSASTFVRTTQVAVEVCISLNITPPEPAVRAPWSQASLAG